MVTTTRINKNGKTKNEGRNSSFVKKTLVGSYRGEKPADVQRGSKEGKSRSIKKRLYLVGIQAGASYA